jgi:nitrogenase molybdenum-iron protein alpha/beta subunit
MTGMLNMLCVSALHMKMPVHFVNNESFVSSFSTGHHYSSHIVKF